MDNNLQKDFEINRISSSDVVREILPIIDTNGDFKEVKGKDAIIAFIKNLLLTPLGTYPFDPNYGSLLYKQLFENCNEQTEKAIYYEVKDRIMMYIDEVEIDSVNIIWNEKNKSCTVEVYIFIKDEKNRTKLSLFMQSYGSSMYNSIDDNVYGDYKF